MWWNALIHLSFMYCQELFSDQQDFLMKFYMLRIILASRRYLNIFKYRHSYSVFLWVLGPVQCWPSLPFLPCIFFVWRFLPFFPHSAFVWQISLLWGHFVPFLFYAIKRASVLGISKRNTLKWNELIKGVTVILEIMPVSGNVWPTIITGKSKEREWRKYMLGFQFLY